MFNSYAPTKQADGVYKFSFPIGNGAMAWVSLEDLGWYARYLFEHPDEYSGRELAIGVEHGSGDTVAKAFTAVTGKAAYFEPISMDEHRKIWPEGKKVGLNGSPGFDDPTLLTIAGHFVPWFRVWEESAGNPAGGLWEKDYAQLDRIHPKRLRSVEDWMRSVNYDGDTKFGVLKTGLN